jgi:hypothetical protein
VRLRRIPTHGEAGSRPVIATAAATGLGTRWHRLHRGSAGLGTVQRHAAAVEQVLAGIVPSWVRRLTPVTLRTAWATATIRVIPDYIAIGSDYLRMSLTLPAARDLCGATGCWLPTAKIVDAAYA